MLRRWPAFDEPVDRAAVAEMEWVVGTIAKIREVRAEMNIPGAAELPSSVLGPLEKLEWVATHLSQIMRLARLKGMTPGKPDFTKTIQIEVNGAAVFLNAGDSIDLDRERARLTREKAAAASELGKIEAKLGNAQFLAKAKPEAIEEQRERQAEKQAALAQADAALARLGA